MDKIILVIFSAFAVVALFLAAPTKSSSHLSNVSPSSAHTETANAFKKLF